MMRPVALRALLIDDDAAFRATARKVLEVHGVEVVGEAGTAAAGLAAARALEPDVVLLDVGLPDEDGVSVARTLAGSAQAPDVVLMSVDAEAASSETAQRAGALGFVAKDALPDAGVLLLLRAVASKEATRPQPVRLVIGEDDVLLREGLLRILGASGFEVVSQAGDARDFLRKALAHKPDAVIVDVRMPPQGEDGIRAAIELRRRSPDVGVLVLSHYYEEEYALELIGDRPEGVGYLLKERVGDVEAFSAAVRRVARGGSALDPEVVGRMMGRRSSGALAGLTPREREVLAAMASGLANNGIAAELHVTEAAVEKHVTRIFSKLDIGAVAGEHRRVRAVLTYLHDRAL